MLQTNKTLSSLSLTRNAIGDLGIQILSESLLTNNSLKSLDVARCLNTAYDSNGRWRGARHVNVLPLLTALFNNQTLTSLKIGECHIGDDAARLIAEILSSNKTLRTLDLYKHHNIVDDAGAAQINEALQHNSTLTTLNLDRGNNSRTDRPFPEYAVHPEINEKLSFNHKLAYRNFVYLITTLCQGRRQPYLLVEDTKRNVFSEDYLPYEIFQLILHLLMPQELSEKAKHIICASFIINRVYQSDEPNKSFTLAHPQINTQDLIMCDDNNLKDECNKLLANRYCETLFQPTRNKNSVMSIALQLFWDAPVEISANSVYVDGARPLHEIQKTKRRSNLHTFKKSSTTIAAGVSLISGILILTLGAATIAPAGFALIALAASLAIAALVIHCCKSGIDSVEYSVAPALAHV